MRNWLNPFRGWSTERKANGLATFIAAAALGWLAFEFPPTPAGADSHRRPASKSRPVLVTAAKPAISAETVADPATEAADNSPLAPLHQKLARLAAGRKFLEQVPDYTATFCKQELVDGELLEEASIQFKCRHQPFSVYLRWDSGDEGRELIYVDGANDGEMIVHGGGWKKRLPALSISPNSSLAMAESRYPITKVGLLELIKTIQDVHAADLEKQNISRCAQLADQEFEGRMCSVFQVEYRDAASSPVYRKSLVMLDKEWNVPVYTRNFGWPDAHQQLAAEELDEATLIEFYTYSGIQFRQQLASNDFDRGNEDYSFR